MLFSYYMPLMAKNAGVVSTKQQLLMNALQSPIMTIGTLLGVRFIDKAGRMSMYLHWPFVNQNRATKNADMLEFYLHHLCPHDHYLQRPTE